MESYLSIQNKCRARREEIISLLNTSEEKWRDLKIGHEYLQEKKDALAKENGGEEVSSKDILNINAGGTIVRVSRGTLTQFEGTRLEAIFSGRWEKQLHRDNLGRIFLDVNPICFKAIVDYLNECKICSPENLPDPPFVDFENAEYLSRLLMAFGLDDLNPTYDSVILSERSLCHAMCDFLREDNIPLGLKLLYRGTRDGMNPNAFHQKCNNMGATLTIVKDNNGYIFGGYTNMPWNSSSIYISSEHAFLFGLSCHGGQYPVKMRVQGDKKNNSSYGHSSYGPTFGGGHDLMLFYNSSSTSSLGSSYILPSGKNKTFFTGSTMFTPLEVEVFQVTQTVQQKMLIPTSKEDTKLGIDALSKNIEECMDLEKRAIAQATEELAQLEKSFEQEKNAVKLFCTGTENSVVNLNVSGHTVAVSKWTLSQYPDSVLYKQFADPKWHESSRNVNCLLPRDWNTEQVVAWVKGIKRLSSDFSDYFKEVTGGELLVMGREDIKDLGIKKPGTVALLLDNIQKLREEDEEMSAPLVEHSEYCIEKIIDRMRIKAMSSLKLVPDVFGPPHLRESEKNRFQRIVDYFFPNDSSNDFVA